MTSPESPHPNPNPIDRNEAAGEVFTLDPKIRALAVDPDGITGPDREKALVEARRLSFRGGQRVILEGEDGQPRWGREYAEEEDVFTLDGTIRSTQEKVPKNKDQWTEPMLMLGAKNIEGTQDVVIIETDDGQVLKIRRTNPPGVISAYKQTFEVVSSTKETGRGDQPVEPRVLDTSMLKDVVVVTGQPLKLGLDPATGTHPTTRGRVTRVTTYSTRDEGIVREGHPQLQKSEIHRDTVQRFNETLERARQANVAPILGSLATGGDASTFENVVSAQAEQPKSTEVRAINPYERLTIKQLESVRDNIVDSVTKGIKAYDVNEVARAGVNLSAIQREFERRYPDKYPAQARGRTAEYLLQGTPPDSKVVAQIAEALKGSDGIIGVIFGIRNTVESIFAPGGNYPSDEAKLSSSEVQNLLSDVVKGLRDLGISDVPRDPYSAKTNQELEGFVKKFDATIKDLVAQGRGGEATSFQARLAQIQEVLNRRRAAVTKA